MIEDNELTVWGVGTTRTMRVHWVLHELGLAYDTKRIQPRTGETQTEEFFGINPKQKIPVLIDGEMVITESTAIMRHLRRRCDRLPYDEYQLSNEGRAAYDEWMSFISMELDATSLYIVRRHKDLAHIYGEAENAVTSSIAYFERMLNSVLPMVSGHSYLWGSTFSELDIHLVIVLDWARSIGVQIPESIDDYYRGMKKRPAYQAAREYNYSN